VSEYTRELIAFIKSKTDQPVMYSRCSRAAVDIHKVPTDIIAIHAHTLPGEEWPMPEVPPYKAFMVESFRRPKGQESRDWDFLKTTSGGFFGQYLNFTYYSLGSPAPAYQRDEGNGYGVVFEWRSRQERRFDNLRELYSREP